MKTVVKRKKTTTAHKIGCQLSQTRRARPFSTLFWFSK